MGETPRYPPVGDPDRYDRIVQRGRGLRRRRRLTTGMGAGGGVAAAALAVVMLTSGGNAPNPQVTADGDQVERVTTTTTTTTTTSTVPPTELTLDLDADAEAITVVVTDPERPIDDDSRQCVTVSIEGDTGQTAEAYGCDDIPAVDGVVTIDLQETGGVLIGCAATMQRPSDEIAEWDTELSSTTFRLVPPSTLGAGEYRVRVDASSGVGDGCGASGDEAQPGEPLRVGRSERSVSDVASFRMG